MPERPTEEEPTRAAGVDPALVERLLAASELHGDFVLSSGKRSGVYFDKFRFLTDPELLKELAGAVATLLPRGVTHLAAPEGAATLLVAAVSLRTGLPVAVVRKEPKAYGTMSQVEGHAPAGATIALIEDVSTTGHQVLKAARTLEVEGCTIGIILLAIDRGGGAHLEREGFWVKSVVKLEPQD